MEIILTLEGVKVYMTHSQHMRYPNRTMNLVQKAKEHGCNLVLFGHTHVFDFEVVEGITLVNPGSLHHNRDGSNPCYALITVDQGKISVQRIDYPRFKTK